VGDSLRGIGRRLERGEKGGAYGVKIWKGREVGAGMV